MTTEATIRRVPITQLVPDSANLREHFEQEDIDALGRNLLEQGQLDPIQVFERGDGTYDLYDGERRWRAAQLVGLDSLQAIVVERPSAEDLICKKVSTGTANPKPNTSGRVGGHTKRTGSAWGFNRSQANGRRQQGGWASPSDS